MTDQFEQGIEATGILSFTGEMPGVAGDRIGPLISFRIADDVSRGTEVGGIDAEPPHANTLTCNYDILQL